MRDVEKLLLKEKEVRNKIDTPVALESRLKHALDSVDNKTNRRHKLLWKVVVAAMLLLSFVGYNYNALAFYGKKIIGFDDVVPGTLTELNEAGMGQVVDKQIRLKSGAELTINGVMSDENRFIVYYTLSSDNGIDIDNAHQAFRPDKLTGWFTNSRIESSSGMFNDDRTELKGTMDFEPPSAFAKKLTLHFSEWINDNQLEEGKVSFAYDPNQAMQASVKQTIDQQVNVDGGTLKWKSIVASPTQTVITGTTDVDAIDRVMQPFHEIELIANGERVEKTGTGVSSSFGSSKVELRFDALPQQLESLQLYVKKFVGYEEVNKTFSLSDISSPTVLVEDKELIIHNAEVDEEKTSVTITTDEDVLLDQVFIESGDEIIPLQTTVDQQYKKTEQGVLKKRTLIFQSSKQPDSLKVGGIHYMKEYDQLLAIPFE